MTLIGGDTAPPTSQADPVRVMICDDSIVIRGAVSRMLESDPEIRVVARAADGAAALRMLRPGLADVLVLDIEMPEIDGLTALPRLLRIDPNLAVIMSSTLTTRGADIALRALRLGAADYVPKPSAAALAGSAAFRDELIAKVKGMARLRRRARPASEAPAVIVRPTLKHAAPTHRPTLLAIGSSTGGPQALFTLVQALGPAVGVPVVLTQHMPASFTPILAKHISTLGALPCREATDGETLRPDHIYLAPGDRHLLVEAGSSGLRATLSAAAAENFCRPSVDPMLRTAAVATAGKTLAVMLTGMGQDGLLGTQALIEAGGIALAQDEETSVVWGMPGAIARAGLCHAVLPLGALAGQIHSMLRHAS
jgi:two-component system chemotaxis response regulator CheB